ncbi:Alpha-1,3-mannosyltransferase MNT2 [Wickerhamomyces ciferrii]|uniref:Alpha-1,3-mannosyltransferase MNT2 n=1 Tax=Wickerhamomyces ciferrii (strain ATCC 14091 / BCRC 22168 / CBS 111 / JCM 3599 / NBRC 0793 / NRRL Y-1031 F-60-10) TaxID=1206466 RepID=K0KQC8_WICCF|nr:Alpha-1,3-mannosyltransferase MNT2 [Wickerhamomyces ciferrii]CCH43438.1 Alpha-1,3-mannosyltransferase MNT2 [Wickerhamomyces ciferrii]
MVLKVIGFKLKTPLLVLILFILVCYNALHFKNINVETSSINNVKELNIVKILEKLDSSKPSKNNCNQFWKEIRNHYNITNDYNDTGFDPKKDTIWNQEPLFHKFQNHTALIRAYNHCYLDQNKCDIELERRIFPWYSFKSPIINHRVKGDRKIFKDDLCFNKIKSNLRKKGIALTAKEFHLRDLINLITLLRALGTSIPLQIIHRGDFSKFAQIKLHEIAKAELTQEIKDLIGFKVEVFPQMNIEFIDISRVINQSFNSKIQKFTNKLLAYLFNTFEEVILIDADTIPFVPLQDFFKLEEYKTKGAFFFKDRALNNAHDQIDTIDLFTKLTPSLPEINKLGIPKLTSYTWDNHFFKHGFKHLMESGLVIVNRKQHFVNPLMAIHLALYPNIIGDRVWGDKELYWLAMAISGDESYEFNSNFAASIGEISTGSQSHYPKLTNTKELCSNHPSHIYKNGKLLWMNTGFKYCKKLMHIDMTNPFFKGMTSQEMDKYNSSPLKIRQAIIPPVPLKANNWKMKNRDKPTFSWENKPYCEAYTLCAYDKLDDQIGEVIEFSEEDQKYFDYLGNIWFKGIDILKIVTTKAREKKH